MDVVIFGLSHLSAVAWYAFTHDSPHRVVGFTVDAAYCSAGALHGLPVVPFETLAETFSPAGCLLSLPIGWRGMNAMRAEKMARARAMGYRLASYVSSRALVWPDLQLGENGMINDGAIVQPFARIGANCNIQPGAMILHDAVIGDHCFVAAGSVIAGSAVIRERCVIGLNSTVRDGVRVAPRCFIGAGAVVVSDTEENGLYVGVPARRQSLPADRLPLVQ